MDNEGRIDAKVEKIDYNTKIVEGFVVDVYGKGISCACVKILDIYSNPLAHTFSDCKGYYRIPIITDKSCFKIFASKDNYKTSEIENIFLGTSQTIKVMIKLEKLDNCLVYGVGYVVFNYKPIELCQVELYRCNYGIITLIQRYITDERGLFVIDGIPDGTYIIVAENSLFYLKECFMFSKGLNRIILNVRLKPNMIKGTISGIITDNQGNRVSDALVILQRKDGKLVKFTRTNSQGEYLFYDVERGEYSIITSAKKWLNFNFL